MTTFSILYTYKVGVSSKLIFKFSELGSETFETQTFLGFRGVSRFQRFEKSILTYKEHTTHTNIIKNQKLR